MNEKGKKGRDGVMERSGGVGVNADAAGKL